MSEKRSREEFYQSFKKKLEKSHSFPEDYIYKFFIPNDAEKLAELYRVFDGTKNTISTRESKNGKYIGITIEVFVLDAAHVIRLYQEAEKIEGIVSI